MPVQKGKALVAAAQILSGPRVQRMPRPRNYTGLAWQADAWAYFDRVGEFENAIDWQAKGVSRMQLAPAREQPGVDEPEILDTGLAADLVAGFAGGTDGQRQLLWRAAQHLQVAGESYIVGRDVDGDQVWEAYSNEEIKHDGARGWKVDDGVDKFTVRESDVLIRAWRPHPRRRAEPSSSAKSALPILAEISGLGSHVLAQVDSRLAGAGLLILPQSMTFASQSGNDVDDNEDPFVAELIDAMVTPIKDRDSAAAVVPIVVKVPDEALGKAQYMRFSDVLDANLPKLKEQAIQRLARALDTPPEVLLGLGTGTGSHPSHWSAWQISEDAVTSSIAPVASIITHALTVGWFRPALEAEGESSDGLMVWPDPTPLLLRPDRSKAATEGHDRLAVSDEAWRRESGFDDADAPEDDEVCRRLVIKLMVAKPDLAPQLWPVLGTCSPLPQLAAAPAGDDLGGGDGPPGQDPGTDPDTEPEGRGLPDRDADGSGPPVDVPSQSASGAVVAGGSGGGSGGGECLALACHGAVIRALEVAGKRLLSKNPRSNRARLAAVPPHRLHEHLPVPTGDSAELAKLTAGLADSMRVALADYPVCVDQLVEYVRSLIAAGQPHDPGYLGPILNRCTNTPHAPTGSGGVVEELADVS